MTKYDIDPISEEEAKAALAAEADDDEEPPAEPLEDELPAPADDEEGGND
jgi:hypothetical protein